MDGRIGVEPGRRTSGDSDRKSVLGISCPRGPPPLARIWFSTYGTGTSRFCTGVLARRSDKQINHCRAVVRSRWSSDAPANDRMAVSASSANRGRRRPTESRSTRDYWLLHPRFSDEHIWAIYRAMICIA
ncbi:hypothetical protein VNO77_41975 [Canavalia gladiata]|uniref:Uncharacterized protein n=1 Tax=Canavalia gladiata TaxID=3824 RepID=A0AAN9PSF8_CANGL